MILMEDLLSGKVTLEFGNSEQINCIDRFQQAQAEEKENLEMGKKWYTVDVYYSGSSKIDVQAYDEFEAEELARDEISYEEIEWEDIEHTEVCLKTLPEEKRVWGQND